MCKIAYQLTAQFDLSSLSVVFSVLVLTDFQFRRFKCDGSGSNPAMAQQVHHAQQERAATNPWAMSAAKRKKIDWAKL